MESFVPKHEKIRVRDFRIIPYMIARGSMNMAIDHYFAENSAADSAVVRFYGWTPCCVSLGFHQEQSKVNKNVIKDKGVELVKRPTGGSAVFHCDELTYSVVFSRNIIDHKTLYSTIHYTIAKALQSFGYSVYLEDPVKTERTEICYNRAAKSEIKYDKKKLVGSAQRLYPNTILQHGSILFSNEQIEMINFFQFDENEKRYFNDQLKKKSTSLIDMDKNINITKIGLTDRIIDQWAIYFGNSLYYKELTNNEIADIKSYEGLFILE